MASSFLSFSLSKSPCTLTARYFKTTGDESARGQNLPMQGPTGVEDFRAEQGLGRTLCDAWHFLFIRITHRNVTSPTRPPTWGVLSDRVPEPFSSFNPSFNF